MSNQSADGGSQTHPPDTPLNEQTTIVCDGCGLEIWSTDAPIDKPAFTCGCDVTVYPTAPNPNFPNGWNQVTL